VSLQQQYSDIYGIQIKEVKQWCSESYEYNQDTGIFTWKRKPCNTVNAGDVAGSKNAIGYLQLMVCNKKYSAHRIAWLISYGEWPDVIDHINGDRSDNRIKNLRNTDMTGNARNKCIQKNNKSGYKGVSFDKINKKWVAYIIGDGKHINLGRFSNVEDAAYAYREAAKRYYGEYANVC